jgi:hypothetical protein
MSKLRLYGATSGYVELAAPDVSDDGVLVLPTAAEGLLKASGGIGSNVVSFTTSTTTTTSSTSYVNTLLTATITPTSSTSKVLIVAAFNIRTLTSGLNADTALFRGDVTGTNIFDIATQTRVNAAEIRAPGSFVFLDSPGVATATTYTVGLKASTSNQVQMFEGQTITLIEVKA